MSDPGNHSGNGGGWNWRPDVGPNLSKILSRVTTHSAMTPTHWQTAISLPFLVGGAILTTGPAQYIFLGLAAAVVFKAAFINVYFAVTDPNRLQREEHVQHMSKLQLLADDRQREPGLVIDSEPVANSHISMQTVPSLPTRRKK
ncbi:MAG: hypothetical protein EOS85_05980 [Mesorhizobium sp.]|nr:MAG: hypothetical protein EOS85_05980 [Mesorhizobium sp.]